ncbi:uncharacterized protein LOC124313784 [Daphnia pulicaria]|uniref:uncharacterized protein LOC124313784 n=1 Tax=Daphnia pulicaria TaxID=35523 RepID=UPI001EEB1782|nr:uncharacterized protein LOC124313784 [Daphnia pulicaria]
MNFIIQMVLFVAICAAVLPGSSAVPVDSEVQGEQAISMREGDVVDKVVREEMDSKVMTFSISSRTTRHPQVPGHCSFIDPVQSTFPMTFFCFFLNSLYDQYTYSINCVYNMVLFNGSDFSTPFCKLSSSSSFTRICAAVLPGSSPVPVDNEVQGEQAISMTDGDAVKETLVEEIDKSARCSECIRRCYYAPNKYFCITNCRTSSC